MTARIRLAGEADAAAIRRIYAPIVEESAISFETASPSESEMADRIASTLERYPWLVCETGGGENEDGRKVVGYAYAGAHRNREAYRWSVDVSVYVDPDHRRWGIARGLYESLFALLELQGFANAYAGIALPNPASVTLHESMGFEPVGTYRKVGYKRGEWHDVRWYEFSLGEHSKKPEPPIGLTDARDSPEWDRALANGESVLAR
jgi:L-amino acid N-acyltransferase YncA